MEVGMLIDKIVTLLGFAFKLKSRKRKSSPREIRESVVIKQGKKEGRLKARKIKITKYVEDIEELEIIKCSREIRIRIINESK